MKRTAAVCCARVRPAGPGTSVACPAPSPDCGTRPWSRAWGTRPWSCQRHRTRVPAPGPEVMEAVPPTARILPMMDPEMPRRRTGTESGSKPRPASDSSTTTPFPPFPSSLHARSSASRTPAWRDTLVTASRTPLNIASPGPDGMVSGPSTCVVSRTLACPSPRAHSPEGPRGRRAPSRIRAWRTAPPGPAGPVAVATTSPGRRPARPSAGSRWPCRARSPDTRARSPAVPRRHRPPGAGPLAPPPTGRPPWPAPGRSGSPPSPAPPGSACAPEAPRRDRVRTRRGRRPERRRPFPPRPGSPRPPDASPTRTGAR